MISVFSIKQIVKLTLMSDVEFAKEMQIREMRKKELYNNGLTTLALWSEFNKVDAEIKALHMILIEKVSCAV